MASGPISSWQIDGETVETVADFIFGGLQNHCRWWLQPWNKKTLFSWKESYDQPRQHIKKQRHYFANKGPSSQSYGFSSSQYGCESWTIKKAEHLKIDAFELWCWRRLLRVPWTARRSNQSILKQISPECSLEGLMLKLKLQYFGHLMLRTDSLEKTLILGKIGGEGDDRGWVGWMASPAQWTWVWVNSRSWWWTGRPGVPQSMGSQRVGHDWATELNWTSNEYSGFISFGTYWFDLLVVQGILKSLLQQHSSKSTFGKQQTLMVLIHREWWEYILRASYIPQSQQSQLSPKPVLSVFLILAFLVVV